MVALLSSHAFSAKSKEAHTHTPQRCPDPDKRARPHIPRPVAHALFPLVAARRSSLLLLMRVGAAAPARTLARSLVGRAHGACPSPTPQDHAHAAPFLLRGPSACAARANAWRVSRGGGASERAPRSSAPPHATNVLAPKLTPSLPARPLTHDSHTQSIAHEYTHSHITNQPPRGAPLSDTHARTLRRALSPTTKPLPLHTRANGAPPQGLGARGRESPAR